MRPVKKALVAAAALTLVGLPVTWAQEMQPSGQDTKVQTPANMTGQNSSVSTGAMITNTAQVQLPPGFSQMAATAAPKVYHTIATATEAAMTQSGFDDFVERLASNDRARVGENRFAEQKFADLDAKVAELRQKFHDKYNVDFNLNDESKIFDTRYITVEGEVADVQTARTNWPVPVTNEILSKSTLDNAQPAGARLDGNIAGGASDNTLDKGRNVSIISVPSAAASGLTLRTSLVHELIDSWKIDIPNSITGQQLHDNLLKQLTYLSDHSAQWPANIDDARRAFAWHVLAAAYNVQPDAGMRSDANDMNSMPHRPVDQGDMITPGRTNNMSQ